MLKEKKQKIANKMLKMPQKELVKEHTHLVKTLEKGSKRELSKEAQKQSRELKGYKQGKI